ncbi:bestrophin-like domain [Achromobacter kerstersii]|uniref:DUF4239 domain-containing protein n=1 Tax=Achromobacter kerstersii TaxID=1353890 RepID=A0A6S7ABB2_9BURK|nr:DUF4239 domain-containing protein [Achromobacter kerstersii]CAB3711007.1 hypothetical protein LMG3441_03130 [Achromobacter kerstersii]
MEVFWIGVAIFFSTLAAALSMMYLYPVLAPHHRNDETNNIIRLVANVFVVMTSLVFGLMINSAKNTFASIDSDVHAYATGLIIFERTLRTYGPPAEVAKAHLVTYVEQAVANPYWDDRGRLHLKSEVSEHLDKVGIALNVIKPDDRLHEAMLGEIRQQYHALVAQRWKILEQSDGAIPGPLIGMLAAWMTLIFATFGYRAPKNRVVVGMLVVASFLIASSVYLVLDMDIPFHGPIQVSDAPIRRALAQISP